jgi:signal transduction histidine kinase
VSVDVVQGMSSGSADGVVLPAPARRSPARLLVLGLALALLTVAAFGAYTIAEIRHLRDEQTAISERNRKDSLQLLRIQNDLASLAFLMRDMAEGAEPYPMRGWQPAFDRLRSDLAEALALERGLAPAAREPAQQARLERSMETYWATVDRIFALARTGDEAAAAQTIRGTLTQLHRELATMVSRFLVVNNRIQEEAASANQAVFDRVGREILFLVVALLIIIAIAGGWIVVANRRAFEEVRQVTDQLRALSWRTLRLQEDLQRSISRELHDDFGQIVTAIGTLLGRARRQLPADAPLLGELDRVRAVSQEALDRIRTRSHWLHPGVLDDFGLEKALARCVEQFEQQTGIRTRFAATGPLDAIRDDYAIHVYRIVQEALGNVSRHSGSREASVRLICADDCLELEVEDRGTGMAVEATTNRSDRGMGLVSMRERAELMGGQLVLRRPPHGGLAVHVRVPAWMTRARMEQEATT